MAHAILPDREFGNIKVQRNRKSRSVSIRIRGESVSMTLPYFMPTKEAVAFLESKRDWIRQTLAKQREIDSGKERIGEIHDGSIVRTLVSNIVFRIGENDGHIHIDTVVSDRYKAAIWLSADNPIRTITVTFPETTKQEQLREVLVDILRNEAKDALNLELSSLADSYGFTYGRLTIKHNISNWGSCSSKGNINLNLNLVRLPQYLCRYVILHELCHLRKMNHGEEFHSMLRKLCTDELNRLHTIGYPLPLKYKAYLTGSAENLPPVEVVLRNELKGWCLI